MFIGLAKTNVVDTAKTCDYKHFLGIVWSKECFQHAHFIKRFKLINLLSFCSVLKKENMRNQCENDKREFFRTEWINLGCWDSIVNGNYFS